MNGSIKFRVLKLYFVINTSYVIQQHGVKNEIIN